MGALPASGLSREVSIVVPVLNQRAYSQECIQSLAPDIGSGAEVIVIDNGSGDETRSYLASLKNVCLLRNETNRGCAPAWNQGVQLSQRAWVVILNNDVVLPPGWLQGLVGYAVKNDISLATPAIREGPLNYSLPEYADDFMRRMRSVERRGTANGVCFLAHRRVFDQIGGFDESFRIGQFEDTDFFWRARQHGFRLGTTGASFLHHYGSATQVAIRVSEPADNYEDENRRRFREKWGLTPWKRFWGRIGRQARALNWRWRERLIYGHTLYEKWIDGRLRYE